MSDQNPRYTPETIAYIRETLKRMSPRTRLVGEAHVLSIKISDALDTVGYPLRERYERVLERSEERFRRRLQNRD